MIKTSAKVIAHSKMGKDELITIETEFPRFILPQVNTHKAFSRNYSSSRAVPVAKYIEQVRTNPVIPAKWGKNQRGMVAEHDLSDDNSIVAYSLWIAASLQAANVAEQMAEVGLAKEVANRVLEPYMWTKGVITFTRKALNAFLKLRLEYDAQPDIQLLAQCIKEVVDQSQPTELKFGEYHLPYVRFEVVDSKQQFYDTDGAKLSIYDAIRISASCCAQVSYRVLNDSLEQAIKVYDMLNLPENGVYPEQAPHYSAAEHQAVCCEEVNPALSGNFHSANIFQYRKALEMGLDTLFREINQ